GVGRELLGDLLLGGGIQRGAGIQRRQVVAHGELLHLGQEVLQLGGLVRDLVVVPGDGGLGRQHQREGDVDGRVQRIAIRAYVGVGDGREQYQSIDIYRRVLQAFGQQRTADGAVALAEDVLGRVPAAVLGEEQLHEVGEGLGVLVHAVIVLRVGLAAQVLVDHAAEAGARGVDEHLVGDVQQAVFVVDQRVGRAGGVGVVGSAHALRTEGAHVQPHGGGTRAAVEEEGHGPVGGRAVLRVVHVEHADGGLVLVVLQDQRAGIGLVADLLTADAHRARGGGQGGLGVVHGGLGGVLRRRVVGPGGQGACQQQGRHKVAQFHRLSPQGLEKCPPVSGGRSQDNGLVCR